MTHRTHQENKDEHNLTGRWGSSRDGTRSVRRLLAIGWIAAAWIGLFGAGSQLAHAGGYQLGPQDKLRIRAFEWRQPIDLIYEWTALNGEFRVGPTGNVSFPLLGEIPAAGLTTDQLAERIGKEMVQQLRLGVSPKVAVEVSEYRPFYIVGAVAKPGAFPYQPQLTILQALSIAGGLPRPADLGMMRLGREVTSGRGQLKELAQKLSELYARRSRLEAELKQADELVFPEELSARRSDPEIAPILTQEENIFKARRTALTTQISTLQRLKEFLVKEVAKLGEQVKLKKTELTTVTKELAGVTQLVEKGLSASSRQFGLERLVAQISSEQLNIETGLLKAQQEISRTEVSIDEAQNNSRIEVASLLRATEAELKDVQTRYATSKKLLYDSEVVFPRVLTSRQREAAKDEPKYAIVRTVDGKTEEIQADETTEVLPGDTVKVDLPVPDDLTAILGESSAVQ
jgi:protein involved in polysaccharide export with SLBB domain